MANKIQIKRGLSSARTNITPASAEPIWTTDTNILYIGDGSTPGGVQVGAGQYLPMSGIDATKIISGTIDIARIPVLPSQKTIVSSGGIANLTAEQQTQIGEGTIVTTTDGNRWVYNGSGSKVLEASYTVLADVTPEWSVIANKPTITNTVFGRSGTVTAQTGDYTTTQVTEGTNLYFTTARAQAAISGTGPMTVPSGVVTHSTADGYHHVPATGTTNNGKFLTSGSTAGSEAWATIASTNVSGLTGWATKAYTNGTTTDVAEGTNLYFTNARAQGAISGTGPMSVPSGVVTHSNADGYHHVPATGTTNNGKFLKSGASAGSESWTAIASTDVSGLDGITIDGGTWT